MICFCLYYIESASCDSLELSVHINFLFSFFPLCSVTRFSNALTRSLSQVNGEGNIETVRPQLFSRVEEKRKMIYVFAGY